MLKIGEFASLTGISIHMLRNYDKIGLLVPAQTDRTSLYRYYNENQILDARRIQVLKDLGFGLKEMIAISGCSDDDLKEKIRSKIKAREREKERLDLQIQRMYRTAEEITCYRDVVFSIKITTLPARRVVSLRKKIRRFEDEGALWEQLERDCAELGIRETEGDLRFAITHSIDLKNKLIDTEVLRTVSGCHLYGAKLETMELPATEAAAVVVKGEYGRISDISSYVHLYIQSTEYEISGVPIRRYFLSPQNNLSAQDYITEYYFPLKKRKTA